jgi:hypothetical protein
MVSDDTNVPQLTYAISPTSATVSTTQNFVLTISNASSQFPVTMKKSGDQIVISNWATLTASFSQISPVAPPATSWRIGLASSYLKIYVAADTTIGPSQSVQFQINNVAIDQNVGKGTLSIVEVVGSQVANPPDIQIGKLGAELQIFAYADPVTVGLGQMTTLTWTIVKGLYVTVRPPDDDKKYYREGDKPYTFSIKAKPFQDARQTTFTLTVVQDPANTRSTQLTIDLSPPIITLFSNDPQPPIRIDGSLALRWNAVYTTQVNITPWIGPSSVPPAGTRTFTSSDLHKLVSGNQSQLAFTLNAQGYLKPATSKITIDLQPVVINYFRFVDFAHSAWTYDVSNATSVNPPPSGNPPLLLSATGPHGPVSQILGGNDLEILVLYADPTKISSGQSATLHYQVQKAASALLKPGDLPLTFDTNGIGQISVSPTVTTIYTVVATDALGNKVSSPVTLIVTALKRKTTGAKKKTATRSPVKRRGREGA